jgi:hypothetical protein
VILFFPCTVTQLGQFKYGITKNKITGQVNLDQTFLPGRYWIGFWKEFVEFPSTLNTIEFSDEKPEKGVQHLSRLVARDQKQYLVKLDVSIQYRLRKEMVGRIYKDMTTLYEDVYISDLRDQLAKAANNFTVSETWTAYASVVEQMFTSCKDVMAIKLADLWVLELWGVEVSDVYQKGLTNEQVKKQKQKTARAEQEQAVVRAQTKVMLANYTRDIQIENAKATALSINIEKNAVAKAEAEIVKARADQLKIIKDTVNLHRVTNGAYNATGKASPYMTDEQLITYQKYMMLQAQAQSHVVVNLADGLGSMTSNQIGSTTTAPAGSR